MNLFGKITDYKSDFITYGRTFEKYKWYKPVLIVIIGVILYSILSAIIMVIFNISGLSSIKDSSIQTIETVLTVITFIPSVYIASKIVKDRPFSSYLTLNTSWNWIVYFKTLAIAFSVYLIITIIDVLIKGGTINNNLNIIAFLAIVILTPFQCFAEELICRGFFMQTFGSWFKIPGIAIILQAILFSIMHLNFSLGIIIFIIAGLCLGFIAWYSKGLEVSSAIHAINNLFSFTLAGLGLGSASGILPISEIITASAVIITTILAIITLEQKFKWFGFNTD